MFQSRLCGGRQSCLSRFLGMVILFPYSFAPRGWAFCDGQLMSIAQNTALFSLLGTTYGGDGATTFALPDLRGRVPMSSRARVRAFERNVPWPGGGGRERDPRLHVDAGAYALDHPTTCRRSRARPNSPRHQQEPGERPAGPRSRWGYRGLQRSIHPAERDAFAGGHPLTGGGGRRDRRRQPTFRDRAACTWRPTTASRSKASTRVAPDVRRSPRPRAGRSAHR